MNVSKLASIMLGAILVIGCQSSMDTGTGEVAQTVPEERDNLKQEFELRLDEIDRRIDELQNSVESGAQAGQEQAEETIQSLREEANEARDAFVRLDAEAPETWETVRMQTEQALADVEQKVDEAWQEIVGSEAAL